MLYLSNNEFSGTPRLDSLPQGLNDLELSNNDFSGNMDLSSLPLGLVELYLGDNEFSGNGTFTPNATWCVDELPAAWVS